jgi:hypothetical protein
VPVSTLKTWIHGEGSASRGLLVLPASRPRLLAFSHLVEAFVLAAIRRGHGVALQRVRKAMRFVQRELAVERPLIHAKFKTDGVDLFVEHWGKLVNASRDGQLSVEGALEAPVVEIESVDVDVRFQGRTPADERYANRSRGSTHTPAPSRTKKQKPPEGGFDPDAEAIGGCTEHVTRRGSARKHALHGNCNDLGTLAGQRPDFVPYSLFPRETF